MELPDTSTFPGRLRYLRMLRGMTQFDLAMKLPVPIHVLTVASWERGESEPRSSRIASLAEALGASVPWLVAGQGETPT